MSDKEILDILRKLTVEEKLLLIDALTDLIHTLPEDQAEISSSPEEAGK